MIGRILGSGLGWAFAGPIGGLIGWWLGSQFDEKNTSVGSPGRHSTRSGDFAIALIVLIAHVLKADGRVVKSELDYVKQFLVRSFGRETAQQMMDLLKNLLHQSYSVSEVSSQINRQMSTPEKLELLHVLFSISQADGHVHKKEVEAIREIAQYISIPQADFDAILAIFIKDDRAPYKILEIDPSASDQDIKKAYRSMASRFHPDKVQHLGSDFQKLAEEKFKAINEAYQQIKSMRGM